MSRRVQSAALVLAALSAAFAAGCKQEKVQSTSGPPPTPVTVAKANEETIPFEVRVVGTADASARVEIKSQVGGQLLRVHFTEGQNVARGALLFDIDSRPYEEALRQAEAALARDRAQLQQAEAMLARDQAASRNADADAARYTELAKAGVISKAQSDQVRTTAEVSRESARASQAAIGTSRAAIESDTAAIAKAKLDISYCQIHAPISGRTGNLLVHAGNLVKANDVPLVVINQVQPIWVTFNVPEQHLGTVRRLASRQKVLVRAIPQDAPGREARGTLSVIDNTVDTATGTIKIKGVFDNADALLWPGEFVNVVLTLGTIANAVTVPSEALQAGQQGQFVYVVKPNNTVEPRIVTPGRSFEKRIAIETGLKPGETVVTDGQLRLFPGAPVRPVAAVKSYLPPSPGS